MRRLFWTFPDGLPGAGLFLLRLAASSALLYGAVTDWHGSSNLQAVLAMAQGAAALFLLAGLATPYWGVGVAAIQVYRAFSDQDELMMHALLAMLGLSLALLGPGATSLDARIFGWRRIDVADARRRSDRGTP